MKYFLLLIFMFLNVSSSSEAERNNNCCERGLLSCFRVSRIQGGWKCNCSSSVGKIKDDVKEIKIILNQPFQLENCFRELSLLFSSASFPHFVSLTIEKDADVEFSVQRARISQESISLLSPLQSMSNLNLLRLGIDGLNGNLFENFSEMRSLSLSGNNLLEITNFTFKSETLRSLTKLDLSSNNITTIEDESFNYLTSLNILNLNGNDLETLPVGAFRALTSLSTLDLSKNRLKGVSTAMFDGLSRLRDLNLQRNEISQVNFSVSTLTRNYTSALSKNTHNASTQHPPRERSTFNLRSIDLSFNKIQLLEPNVFENFPKINSIDLSFNKIRNITLGSFSSISSLRKLNLTNNKATHISSIEPSICKGKSKHDKGGKNNSSKLSLVLADNELESLPSNAFRGFCSLSHIDISFNRISVVSPFAFQGLSSLKNLNLSYNKLETFAVRSNLSLTELDLRSNLFVNASSKWLRVFSTNRRPVKLLLGGNNIMCNRHLADIFLEASCNRKYPSAYAKTSVQELLSLSKVFSDDKFFSLPDPGCCEIHNKMRFELKYKMLKTDMQRCVLQSLLDLMAHLKNSEKSENIFKLLLTRIEDLYNDAIRYGGNNKNLTAVKSNILKGISETTNRVFLNGSKSLFASIGTGIQIGATEVKISRSRSAGALNNLLSFKLKDGEAKLESETVESRILDPDDLCRIDSGSNDRKQMKRISISLPSTSYWRNDSTHTFFQKIFFVVYQNDFLFPSNSTVVSAIVSADVSNMEIANLRKPVVINACVNVTNESENEQFKCGYWSFDDSEWKSEGCHLNETKKINFASRWQTRVTCHCNHLTNFAVLLNTDPSNSKPANDSITNSITISGLTISIISLIITIIYRLSIAELRKGIPQVILLHLCFNLLFLYIFTLMYDREAIMQNKGMCFFTAICLQFFLLSIWGWQVIEGLSMYLLIVRVFNKKMEYFLTKATISCYAVSLLFVVSCIIFVSFVSSGNEDAASRLLASYSLNGTCVLSYPYNIYFAVFPVGVGWFVNCVLFAFVLHALKLSTAFKVKKKSKKITSRLRQAISVSTLLGTTWTVGVAKAFVQRYLEPSSDVVWSLDIAFSAMTSLQGFFIFLMFCVVRHYRESKCSNKTPPMAPSTSSAWHPQTFFTQLSNRSLTRS